MKKIIFAAFAALITLMLTTLSVFAESSGFAAESETITSAQTPYDKKYVSIDWNTSAGEDVGVPIAYKDFLLIPTINKVNKLSEKDGSIVGTAELNEKVSKEHKGTIIGNTLLQPTRTSIYAVNLDDMSVDCSKKFGEIITDVAVIDNLVYFGYKDNEKFKFCCADFANNLETVWEYTSDKTVTSPARINDKILFGTGENLIVRMENDFVENPVGAEITHVFAGKYAVFMSCSNGELRKLRLDGNGKTEEDSQSVCKLDGELTQPLGVENHIYVGSTEGFFIVDGLNMEIMKKFDELKNSSAPVVTIGSGVRAYTAAPHSDKDGDRWYLYSILDTDEGQSAAELAKIIDFTDGKAAVSASGKMYFRDANGQVWAISETKPNVFIIVLKIVLIFAIIAMVLIILRAWAKKRQEKKPPQY